MSESLRDLVVSLSLNSDNFSRNIKSVTSQIKEAESRFALAGTGMKGFENTAAGLGSKLGISNDNRRNYTTNNATTVNVDKLVVQDKQDVRALAQEIGVVQRRAAMGMGG